MLATTYCSLCKNKLKSYGGPAFQLYDRIFIEYLIDKKPIKLCTLDHANFAIEQIIHFLENKNYIVTTEAGKHHILIKPKGMICSSTLNFKICHICFDREKHNRDF